MIVKVVVKTTLNILNIGIYTASFFYCICDGKALPKGPGAQVINKTKKLHTK
jgi:hypothetical protein